MAATRPILSSALRASVRAPSIRQPTPLLRRTLLTSARTSIPRTAVRSTPRLSALPRPQNASKRPYSSGAEAPKKSSKAVPVSILLASVLGATYYLYSTNQLATYFPSLAGFADPEAAAKPRSGAGWSPSFADYQRVYNDIAASLDADEYDDGSYAPVLVRLGWHASGTYDKVTGTGGSNGATMRFEPESGHGANAGLRIARDVLENVKAKHPWITYSDLWTLAAVAAIQEMQGPAVPWRPGRSDKDMSSCTPDGRLPDASKNSRHIRDIFYRMGFDDREIVALLGAHAIGRCHDDRSGFNGPWTFSPTVFTNEFYKLLMNEKWSWKKWGGPQQFEDVSTKTLMMLPTDMELIKDKEFKKHVERYAFDEEVFFREFSESFAKLLELGVPFERDEKWVFKTVDQQEEEAKK